MLGGEGSTWGLRCNMFKLGIVYAGGEGSTYVRLRCNMSRPEV